MQKDRTAEWFVPKSGSRKFKIGVGILFLPYTGVVTCFAIWGSMVDGFAIERTIAIAMIYFLAVGVSAHFLDAVYGKTKPWGTLPKRKLVAAALIALGISFGIGIFYAIYDSPLLIPIGIVEGFFLFAYNMELFGGKFHNNASTVFSWGILPVFAGSAIQSNSISLETLLLSAVSGIVTYLLIITSRKYKHFMQSSNVLQAKKKEHVLKAITFGVLAGTVLFFFIRV